ncbi:MAG: hypothetical protein LBN98_04525 [Prevotellaceae bacterium]|jgi:hypothetical protein|nr:hypothetical protein [Prevotellaceae bacterium]
MKRINFYLMAVAITITAFVMMGCGKDDKKTPDPGQLFYEADDAPPYAASDTVWVFGEQEWSDAIQIPECNKTSFLDSDVTPSCRSYIHEGTSYYYYNWPYASVNAATLCPSPWRLPSQEDVDTPMPNKNYGTIAASWGYGGWVHSITNEVNDVAYDINYWTSTKGAYVNHAAGGGNWLAWSINLTRDRANRNPDFWLKADESHGMWGYQVRCVRDR